MAAGMGSRYGGIKQIDPVGEYGEVILHYSVYDALQAGFGKIVFVIRPEIERDFREAVLGILPPFVDVALVFQELDTALPFPVTTTRTKPWGTAHAALCAADSVDTPFVVINADDYYGAEVFRDVIPFMKQMDAASTDFAMAGYTLRKTLSRYGYVSRGICETDSEGNLTSIVEWERIETDGKTIRACHKEGEKAVIMTGSEATSMNFFCLTPGFFEKTREAFKMFLSEEENLEKNEIYLPVLLGDLISRGEASVKVIPTESQWFGMTYREDRPVVKKAFRKLIESNVYPSPLWKENVY